MRTYQIIFRDGLTQFAAGDGYRISDGKLIIFVAEGDIATYDNTLVRTLNDLGPAIVGKDEWQKSEIDIFRNSTNGKLTRALHQRASAA